MLFSVIIPIYNAEKTLDRCLKSLQQQNFADFQAILVDDGSSDSSGRICRQFEVADDRFRYIRQENQGVSSARNAGIDQAEGEYIAFLDSDDVYYTDYLEEFQKLIVQYPEHESFWCGFQYISDDEKENGRKCLHSHTENISVAHRSHIMDLHEKTLEAALWNKVYKKDIIRDNRIKMLKELSLGEDLIFNYEYLDHCANPEIILLNKCLYGYYAVSSDSLNNRFRVDLKEIYDLLNAKTLTYLEKWDVSESQITKQYNCMYYRMDSVLRNTFREECLLTTRQKYQYNNVILRSSEFKGILKRTDCRIHPFHRVAYFLCSYHMMRMVDWMAKKMRKVKRKVL